MANASIKLKYDKKAFDEAMTEELISGEKPKKHIISFSGGAASFAAACLAVEKYGRENVMLVFCDTMIEDADLYRFIGEAVAALGCEFVHLKDGRDPWQVFADNKYQGNTRLAHCTIDLKGRVFARWLTSNFGPADCVIHFGFDWSESHRLDGARNNWAPYTCEALLCHPPYLSRQQVFNFLDDHDIEPPRLYEMGFSHNNCGGFCVKAGQAHFKLLLEKLPEVYAHHEKKQEQLLEVLPNAKPFLRMKVNKKLNYLTLREFREHLERGGEHEAWDRGGCGCFSEGGDQVQEIVEQACQIRPGKAPAGAVEMDFDYDL